MLISNKIEFQEPLCEEIIRRNVPKSPENPKEGCFVIHGREFAEAHLGQKLLNIDLRGIVWEDKCNPEEKICIKKPTEKKCKTVCEPHDLIRQVPKVTQECTPQAPKSRCKQEFVRHCYPAPPTVVYTANGQKKAKAYKGHIKSRVKRHAIKSKGMKGKF